MQSIEPAEEFLSPDADVRHARSMDRAVAACSPAKRLKMLKLQTQAGAAAPVRVTTPFLIAASPDDARLSSNGGQIRIAFRAAVSKTALRAGHEKRIVIVIGATNRADVLDAALLRPGGHSLSVRACIRARGLLRACAGTGASTSRSCLFAGTLRGFAACAGLSLIHI